MAIYEGGNRVEMRRVCVDRLGGNSHFHQVVRSGNSCFHHPDREWSGNAKYHPARGVRNLLAGVLVLSLLSAYSFVGKNFVGKNFVGKG